MNNLFKILLVILSMCKFAHAQNTFNITTSFGVDVASNILETDSGYYTSISSGQPTLPRHAIFCFYDTTGNLIRNNIYGDSLELYNDHSLFLDSKNNFIMGAGYFSLKQNHYQLSLRKIASNASNIWLHHYAQDTTRSYYGNWVYNTVDSGFILPAEVADSIDGNIYVIKVDSSGTIKWDYELLGNKYDQAFDAAETIIHDYLVVGWTNSFGNGNLNFRDAIVVCIDSSGNNKWKKTFGASNVSETMYRIISSHDGNFIISGERFIVGQYGNSSIWKIDSLGNLKWQKYYLTKSNVSEFYGIQELANGQIIAVGSDRDTSTHFDQGWIALMDSIGNILKERRFTLGNDHCIFIDVKQTKDGGFIIVGYVFGGPNGEDGWIVKLDSNLCDVAGCATNTAIHEITNYKDEGSVIIFPNPCADNLFIKPEFGINILSATVYDITGMEIKTTSYRSRELFQINTSELSSGIYLAKLKTESGFKTIKFVKQ